MSSASRLKLQKPFDKPKKRSREQTKRTVYPYHLEVTLKRLDLSLLRIVHSSHFEWHGDAQHQRTTD